MAAGTPTALVWRDKSDCYFMISATGVREFKMDAEKDPGEDGYGEGTISKSSDIVARLLLDQNYSVHTLIGYPTFFCMFSYIVTIRH